MFAVSVALGSVLLWASAQKIRAPREFVRGVAQYGLLPQRATAPASAAVVAVEAVTGALLLSTYAPVIATMMASLVFTLFTAALAISLGRGINAPCYCFGANEAEVISRWSLVRAALMAVLSLIALWIARIHDPQLVASEVVPALTLAVAIVMVIRSVPLFPVALRVFRLRPDVSPTRTPRISFRSQPPEFSFSLAVSQRRNAGRAPVEQGSLDG